MRSFTFRSNNSSNSTILTIAVAILLFFSCTHTVFGATLSFLPTNGSYAIGSTITVGVYGGSNETPVNAASGVISYPQDKLEVIGISKNQSIVSLWVQEPSFSNSAGSVNFEGIILNPGFKGTQGKILTVTFKVKTQGAGILSFTSGSLLANDGEGTELLSSKGSASFTLVSEARAEVQEVAEVQEDEIFRGAPKLPEVTSATHRNGEWSSHKAGIFSFGFSDSVTAIRLLIDENPTSAPTVVYSPAITEKEIFDLQEGVSYLHVQSKSSFGWSLIEHFKVQVDTAPPEPFVITEVAPLSFFFSSQDTRSGIREYMVQIDGQEPVPFVDDGSHLFKIANLQAGNHTLRVTAFDNAGNSTKSEMTFVSVTSTPILNSSENEGSAQEYIQQKGTFVIAILSVVIPFIALVLLLGGLLFVTWKSLGGLRKHMSKEVMEAKLIVHTAFTLLKDDLVEDIATLEKVSKKRKLTAAEAKILKRLRQNIDEAEAAISKEINDIEGISKV